MGCIYCAQDEHFMCREEGECCCHDTTKETLTLRDAIKQLTEPKRTKEDKPVTPGKPGRKVMTENMKDALSTGRKRAAELYGIAPGQLCAWAWRKRCGGGVYPIIGCSGRKAAHIHHGPDKSVVNNSPDNISVVCSHCHNLWHSRNDEFYPGKRPDDGSSWLPIPPEDDMKIYALSDSIPANRDQVLRQERELNRDMSHLEDENVER